MAVEYHNVAIPLSTCDVAYPPGISYWILPEEERQSGHIVGLALSDMRGQIDSFRQALSLADFCDLNRNRPSENDTDFELIKWKMIAGRDATLTVYNFNETRQTLLGQRSRAPTLFCYVDMSYLGTANSLFEKNFQGFGAARQGVAHAGRLYSTPEVLRKNTIGKNEGGASIISMMNDRTIGSVINGKLGSISLTSRSAEILEEVFLHYAQAFSSVSDHLRVLDLQDPKGTLSSSK